MTRGTPAGCRRHPGDALWGGSPGEQRHSARTLRAPRRVSGTTDDGRKVAGTFTPESFAVSGGDLVATGDLDLVVRGQGKPVRETVEDVTFTVAEANAPAVSGGGMAAAPSCQILHLVLGPLDLDLLGLQVHLDQVVLDITAQSGPGNLLGNLLCSVAGLLDGSPLGALLEDALAQLSDLLNQILGALEL